MNKNISPIIGSISFVGDVFLHEGNTIKMDTGITQYLSACDIRSCNIEAPIKYGDTKAIIKAGPCLQQPSAVVQEIERNGFNLANLANNHITDYGTKALEKTIESLRIPHIGVGKDLNQATRPYFTEIGKLKIGFLAFGEAEFGAIINSGDTGFAWVNHPETNNIVGQAKAECDILILQVHAGIELIELPLPEWRKRYKELIDYGADAIVATHPHVPQGWEIYNGHPIFYSLGNFFFDSQHSHPFWNKGLMAFINVHEDKSLSIDVKGIQRKESTIQEWKGEEFVNYTSYLCHILQEADYEEKINELAIALWNKVYKRHYENAINGVSGFNLMHLLKFIKRLFTRKGENIPLLLHNIRIESHHWIVTRALNQLYKKNING